MTMLSEPGRKYRPLPPVNLPDRQWPRPHDHPPAALAVDRPARRQPGDRRSNGRGEEEPLLRPAGAGRRQGDRDRLPGSGADRVRLHSGPRPLGQHSRRRDGPGAHPGAQGPDPAFVREPRRRTRGDRPRLQRAQLRVARDRVPHEPRRGEADRCQRRQAAARRGGQAARDRVALRIFARDLLDRRARFQPRDLRRGDGRAAADERAAADPQSAGDGRSGDAQRLRRPDRVLLPQPAQPRGRVHQPAHAQRPWHRRRRCRTRPDGWCRSRGRLPVRQRRADRQLLPGDGRPQHVHARD